MAQTRFGHRALGIPFPARFPARRDQWRGGAGDESARAATWRGIIPKAPVRGNTKHRRAPLAPLDPLQRYTVEEAIAYLRSSRRTIYADISEGRLGIIKEGARTYVPGSEIVRRSALPDET